MTDHLAEARAFADALASVPSREILDGVRDANLAQSVIAQTAAVHAAIAQAEATRILALAAVLSIPEFRTTTDPLRDERHDARRELKALLLKGSANV